MPLDDGALAHMDQARRGARSEPPHTTRAPRGMRWGDRRIVNAVLVVGFIGGSALIALVFYTPGDLDAFRWPMAEMALHGHPLLVYSVHAGQWRSDNGPVSLVPLTLVAAVANALGWQESLHLRADLTIAAFGVFSLLLAREAVLAIEAGRGRLPHPLAASALFLLAPPLWIGVVGYGHVDLPIELWLTLLTVRLLGRRNTVQAGFCLGLAVLTRTTVLLSAIPLVLLLVSDRRSRSAAALAGTAAVTVVAGLLPFLVADARDVVQSLVTYRGDVPSLGGSFWQLIRGPSWAGFIQHWDVLALGGAAVALTAAAVWRRPGGTVAAPRVYALLAVSAACLPLLAKSVWPYYLVDPYIFATIWWLGRPGTALDWRVACPVLLAACAVLLAVHPPLATGAKTAVGVATSTAVALVIALILGDWFVARDGRHRSDRRGLGWAPAPGPTPPELDRPAPASARHGPPCRTARP